MIEPYYETNLGKLYHGDSLDIMPNVEPLEMVITSPPYDDLRVYNGYAFDWRSTANEIKGALLPGGVCVWVVGDQTTNGTESGTSFKQALWFKHIGFNLHDTMFYKREPRPLTHNRYEQAIEYMFVFSKGRPRTFNPIMERTTYPDRKYTATVRHDLENLEHAHGHGKRTKLTKIKSNCWHYGVGKNKSAKDPVAFEHPAIFPEALAMDHIMTWTSEMDKVMDPMIGSGTTAIACERLNRRWIGIEISEEYCEIAAKRIEQEISQTKLPGF